VRKHFFDVGPTHEPPPFPFSLFFPHVRE
jgi:hypothetical protein